MENTKARSLFWLRAFAFVSKLSVLRFGRSGWTLKIFPFVEICANRDVKKADHHFLVGLIAPAHGGRGIGIVRVGIGVVVPRDRLQLRSCGERQRLSQLITQLPVKIPV